MLSTLSRLSAAALLAASLLCPTSTRAEAVDLELALLLDASASVSSIEWAQQMGGYINAFRNPSFQQAVANKNGVAVYFLIWANADRQHALAWQRLDTVEDCAAYATLLENTPRPFSGFTEMAPALGRTFYEFRNNAFEGVRQVIDVSGDGPCQNQQSYAFRLAAGMSLERAMATSIYHPAWPVVINARDPEVTINGISIGDEDFVKDWYETTLVQGPDSFAMHVDTFGEFDAAILTKLLREVGEAPAATVPFAYD